MQAWQRQFPAEKLDGYWTLLFARYWAGRGKYVQAIAQAEQLQAVNPDSPYIDQLLYLAADCEMRLGRKDRAIATLHSLLKDYPGSPLAPKVRKQVEMLEAEKKRDSDSQHPAGRDSIDGDVAGWGQRPLEPDQTVNGHLGAGQLKQSQPPQPSR